jgi:hypothetical protein
MYCEREPLAGTNSHRAKDNAAQPKESLLGDLDYLVALRSQRNARVGRPLKMPHIFAKRSATKRRAFDRDADKLDIGSAREQLRAGVIVLTSRL